ncbi:unnamed protein product [Cuscuta europaea]|uniref:Uncharacterized protein n=1 Tax=Cuscuta europaea TaxID=41803 RepID=A0A9P0VMV3_CUSEU|nr:unnamed protein product [Cuscuta europaea]
MMAQRARWRRVRWQRQAPAARAVLFFFFSSASYAPLSSVAVFATKVTAANHRTIELPDFFFRQGNRDGDDISTQRRRRQDGDKAAASRVLLLLLSLIFLRCCCTQI